MKKRIFSILLTAIMLLTMVPFASAASSIPTSFKAPSSLIASEIEYETDLYFSVDSELLKFIDDEQTDHASLGINSIDHTAQIDWKLNDGDWHYTSDWDDLSGEIGYESGIYAKTGYLSGDTVQNVSIFDLRNSIGEVTPLQTMLGNAMIKGADEEGYDNRLDLENNTFYFRVRLMVSYNNEINSETSFIFSPWSEVLTYGKGATTLEKPTRLEKPTISNPVLGKNPDGSPKISYTSITPKQIQDASNYISAKDMKSIEVDSQININNAGWIEAEDGVWWLASEFRSFNVPISYIDEKNVVIDKAYIQIRTRYVYEGGANVGALQSEWSNIITINSPAWNNASEWAKPELVKASDYGLIPASLVGADMTKPITREEFAEVVMKLYEKTTGVIPELKKESNPFTDTDNPEIIKAFQIGITTGTSTTTFDPKKLINREQVATMLSRAIRIMVPTADFSTDGAPTFKDEKYISSWALEHVKYMSKIGIVKGSDGNFMPSAITPAQKAAGYANTTREQALAMSLRSFEKYKTGE